MQNIQIPDDWNEHIKGFKTIKNNDLLNRLHKEYPLEMLSDDKLFFTDDLEDDRVNVTAALADYDWMHYTYDTRFPTRKTGTYAVRFEYAGCTECSMFVKQFLPAYLTGYDENYVVYHEFSLSADEFNRFYKKDLLGRIASINGTLAYSPQDLMIDWFNYVLENGIVKETPDFLEAFYWESVRYHRIKESE